MSSTHLQPNEGATDTMTTINQAAVARADGLGAATSALVPLLSDYLDDLASRTAARLGEVAGVAVTLGVADGPLTVGASSDLAADVDAIQYEVGVGPCLYALHEGIGMYVPDLANDHRWNDYGPRAAARGAASCVSIPVLLEGRPAAAFKVYASSLDGLSQTQRDLATSVAAEVAGGIGLARQLSLQAQTIDDRESAMDTRRVIDLALGVLMERSQCNANQAFTLLRKQSQNSNVKLRDVAGQVLATVEGAQVGDAKSPFKQPGARLS
jgi:GAF domain-containing protein